MSTSPNRIRVLLADDHTLVAEGLARLIEADFDLVSKVSDGQQAVDEANALRPDVVLLDISMPVLNGIEAARKILTLHPDVKVIFITMHADTAYVREAFRAGGSGYILKRSAVSEIGLAIRKAMAGQTYVTPLVPELGDLVKNLTEPLTQRQREVLQLVAEGLSAKEVAHLLNISVKTAEFHKQVLMRKLGLHTSVELAAYAIRNGLSRVDQAPRF